MVLIEDLGRNREKHAVEGTSREFDQTEAFEIVAADGCLNHNSRDCIRRVDIYLSAGSGGSVEYFDHLTTRSHSRSNFRRLLGCTNLSIKHCRESTTCINALNATNAISDCNS